MTNIPFLSKNVSEEYTCAPFTASNPRQSPEFIRLPKSGTKCPHCSLARSQLNSYILPTAQNGFKPPVRSHLLRQCGKKQGVRVIHYQSLCDFIRSHDDGFTSDC